MRLLIETRRRGVLKVATAYLAVSWLTLEIGHTLFNIFELPHTGLQAIFVLLALGFPLAMMATWQGWFGSLVTEPIAGAGGHEGHGPEHASHPEHSSHHEGPIIAVVFGAVALIAVAVAIGVRFFGMGHQTPSHGAQVAQPPSAELHSPPAPAAAMPSPATSAAHAQPVLFSPPARSIAVLPFVNMSGDSGQDYFSDGLSEELLNSLARIRQLQVAARTSSFSFKGKSEDIADIARKLNVGAILEGSVRKDGTRIRISAQLVNSVSGFQLWSETYDRDLKHVLSLQTDIASAVTTALKATLLGTSDEVEDVGGTDNPRAFDAYLRAQRQLVAVSQTEKIRLRLEGFSEAIQLDPKFAKAYAARASWHTEEGADATSESEGRRAYAAARADAEKAIQLAPTLGRAYGALATALSDGYGDYTGSAVAAQRAKELAPSDVNVLTSYAILAANLGHADEAIAASQRAVMLDPLTARVYRVLARAYASGRQHAKALDAIERSLRLDPTLAQAQALRCETLYHLQQLEAALKACEMAPPDWYKDQMSSIVLFALNRREEAEKSRAKMWAAYGKQAAYQQATIYAQWHDTPKALDFLEMAEAVRDPGLSGLPSDALLNPLRTEPRFRAVVKKMNLPL